ncbi:hypothetical protein GBA52_015488 [Prunus armeniaca]|nr:hypothetical protein GBA52_015488 [Prunus armeniaca]
MFSEMTFLLTESLELVEGNEASGPAGPTTGEESFDCERRITAAFRSDLSLFNKPAVISLSKESLDVAVYT